MLEVFDKFGKLSTALNWCFTLAKLAEQHIDVQLIIILLHTVLRRALLRVNKLHDYLIVV